MLLIGNGRLISHDAVLPYMGDGCLAVEGGRIAAVGETAPLRARYPDAEFYDAKGRVVMPGLINAHTHIYSAFARGLSLTQKQPSRNFLDILNNQWWRMDKALTQRDVYYSAVACGLESVRSGVTTIFDHHASPNNARGSLFAISEALTRIGLRACLCYEVSDRDGAAIAQAGIEENLSFIAHAEKTGKGLLAGMFGLHASFTLSDATLEKCLTGQGAGFHIHVAEDQADVADSLQKYGCRVVERLYKAGILGPKTLAIHGVHIDSAEMELLRETATMAVHNPESNMANAVGCADALAMLKHGVLLGLGTDAYTQDMFESLKVANLIHKHQRQNPSVGFYESLQMLFVGNASIAARFFAPPLGMLKEGAAADIIVVDYTPPTPINASTLGGHMMFGLSGRMVDTVLINGRFVMKEREIVTMDEQALLFEARKQAEELWRRV